MDQARSTGTEIKIHSSGCETIQRTSRENATQTATLNQSAAPGQQEKSPCQSTSKPRCAPANRADVQHKCRVATQSQSKHAFMSNVERQVGRTKTRASIDIANHVPPMRSEYRKKCSASNCQLLEAERLLVVGGTRIVNTSGAGKRRVSQAQHNMFAMCRAST